MRSELGSGERGAVAIDVERLVAGRMLVEASSGAGKSWTVRRLLEQTHGAVQQLVLDPEGEFHTLRARFDFVLAGPGGDCPAEPRSAALLARKLLELGVSAIVDLSDANRTDQRRFVDAFLRALVHAPRSLWHPCLVVIDEADIFAPEGGKSGAESLDAVVDLCARGRKRGFAAVLATQRLAKLKKDAAAECTNVLVGRTNLDADRKRAAELLGLDARGAQALARLADGEFWATGPAFGGGEPELVKVGPVATEHPRAGRAAAPPTPARGKVAAMLEQLRDLPAEAQREAETVDELRAEVRELRSQLRAVERAAPAPTDEHLARARTEGVEHGRAIAARVLKEAQARAHRAELGVNDAIGNLTSIAEALGEPFEELDLPAARAAAPAPARRAAHPAPPSAAPADAAAAAPLRDAASGIDGPMQRILDAIAWLEAAGIERPFSRMQVAFLASYKPGTGAFQNALSRLSSAGLVTYPLAGHVEATDAGFAAARAPTTPRTTEELHARVFERIDGPMRRCLEPLIDEYPSSVARAELAERASYQASTGAFQNALSRLKSLGLIAYPSTGEAVACSTLFLSR